MLKYSIKRIVLAFITTFIILTLTFFLIKSLPTAAVVATDKKVVFAFYMDQVELGYCEYFVKPAVEQIPYRYHRQVRRRA